MKAAKKITAICAAVSVLSLIPGNIYAYPQQRTVRSATELKPGDRTGSFTVKSVSDYDTFDASVVVFEHDKTGATVQYIKNDDQNRCFMLEFDTRAHDNKGTAHVFEHSVTNGSKKYPSRSLTMAMFARSYLTYGNAVTQDRCTLYPIASLSEDQLLKFADYYTDLCFNPMILTNEDIFRSEAWRYTMTETDGDIGIGGTIYSEMSGNYTPGRMAVVKAFELLKPGSPSSYDTGGVPSEILKLTYDEVRDYHEKYYHPSNCVAYLYGDIKNVSDFLDLLDGYFSAYDKREPDDPDGDAAYPDGYFEKKYDYPAQAGSPTDGRTSIVYATDLGKLSDINLKNAYALMRYCEDDSSVVILRLKSLYPSATFSFGMETDTDSSVMYIRADNMNENDAGLFKKAVQTIFSDLAKGGLSARDISNFAKRMEEGNALARDSRNAAVSMLMNTAELHSSGLGSMFYAEMEDGYADMEWFDNDIVRAVAKQCFCDPVRSSISVVVPRPGLAEKNADRLRSDLAKKRSSMTEADRKKLVADTKRIVESATDDPSKYLDEINVVKVSDLTDVTEKFTTTDKTDREGTRRIGVHTSNDRINCTMLYLDATGLAEEDLMYMTLYTDLVNGHFIPTDKHTRNELPEAINESTVKGSEISFTVSSCSDEFTPYVTVAFMSAAGDDAAAFDLTYERLFESRFDDPAQIREGISAVKNNIRKNVTAHPENLMQYLVYAGNGRGAAFYEYTHYIEYYDFLSNLEKQMEKDPKIISGKLYEMGEYIRNRRGAIIGYATAKRSEKDYLACADAFADRLDGIRREAATYRLPRHRYPLGVVIDRQMVYNGIGTGNLKDLGMQKDTVAAQLAFGIVSDSYLRSQARDRYGAYGYSYRYDHPRALLFTANDPNSIETMDIFANLGDAWKDICTSMEQKTLDEYIVTTYSRESLGNGETGDAVNLIGQIVAGRRADHLSRRLADLKKIRISDLSGLARTMEKLGTEGKAVTIGSEEIIGGNRSAYAEIIRPFD